ncbi:MAG: RsmD family RNA methyltransferase [Phycisphaerae bacterium]
MSSAHRQYGHMRIIAGKWRSRRLAVPASERTRPMPDRIREAVYDILGSRLGTPGALPAFAVADLFAGSGGMGLEALSRGAKTCDFVERRVSPLRVLRANLDRLDARGCSRVIHADAWTVALSTPRPSGAYGLIVVDPPFVDARDTSASGKVVLLLSDLYRALWADADTVILLHHETQVAYQPGPRACWNVWNRRVYGRAAVTFIEQRTPDENPHRATDKPKAPSVS